MVIKLYFYWVAYVTDGFKGNIAPIKVISNVIIDLIIGNLAIGIIDGGLLPKEMHGNAKLLINERSRNSLYLFKQCRRGLSQEEISCWKSESQSLI